MDPNANPFNPGAGSPPPELVGRDSILTQTDVILERIKRGRSERSLLLVGLRGVGKTVLLREIRRHALEKNYAIEMIEAQEEQTIAQLLVPALRRLLLELDSTKKTIAAVKRGLRVLRSFLSTIKVKASDIELTLGIDPEEGRADSGDLESDLKDLLLALGEASKEAGRPIALLVDELQYLPRSDLAALIRSLHAVAQESLPFVLFGAGLPQLFSQVGEAKSYAERLFRFSADRSAVASGIQRSRARPGGTGRILGHRRCSRRDLQADPGLSVLFAGVGIPRLESGAGGWHRHQGSAPSNPPGIEGARPPILSGTVRSSDTSRARIHASTRGVGRRRPSVWGSR